MHQANFRLIMKAADELGIPRNVVPTNVREKGNLTSPSTIVLLDEAIKRKRARKGDLVAIDVVGAGMGITYGGAWLIL